MVEQWEDSRIFLIGDFNAILETGKRIGEGGAASLGGARGLKELISNNKLHDVNIQGKRFTWYRSHGACKSRIDRAFVNDYWLECWREPSLRGLPRSISDHCPIILNTKHLD